jgi:hypothetical protein
MKRSNVKLVVGFDHQGLSPKVLYAGTSLKKAEFCEAVALASHAFAYVRFYLNPIPTKTVDFTKAKL